MEENQWPTSVSPIKNTLSNGRHAKDKYIHTSLHDSQYPKKTGREDDK